MTVKITEKAYHDILNYIPEVPPESGGILGCISGIIAMYHFDSGVKSTKYSYSPNVIILNSVIKRWQQSGIMFCGIFHSHVAGGIELSKSDIDYAERILNTLPTKKKSLLFPVVIPHEDIIFYRGDLVDNRISISREIPILVK